jgi:hypothetical protein
MTRTIHITQAAMLALFVALTITVFAARAGGLS